MASAAAGLEYGARRFDLHLTKRPVPLRSPLRSLARSKIEPYRFVDNRILPPEMVEELGTNEYIHWVLEDTSQNVNDPTRVVSLFVSYYTGQPDPVPHVPDVCYLGGGYQQVSAGNYGLAVPELERFGLDADVPFRAVTFGKPGLLGTVSTTVCYTFSANGALIASRNLIRLRLGNWSERYAYFSKVEATFTGTKGQQASQDEAVEASKRLFRTILPVLVADHWPDWRAVTRQTEAPADQASSPAAAGRT